MLLIESQMVVLDFFFLCSFGCFIMCSTILDLLFSLSCFVPMYLSTVNVGRNLLISLSQFPIVLNGAMIKNGPFIFFHIKKISHHGKRL